MDTIESIDLVYRNPKVRQGQPCLVGTSVRVMDIAVAMIFADRSPDQLAQDYDLSMAQVHAALSFYFCNKSEIDAAIRDDIRRSNGLGARFPRKIQRPEYEDISSNLESGEPGKAATATALVALATEAHENVAGSSKPVPASLEEQVD